MNKAKSIALIPFFAICLAGIEWAPRHFEKDQITQPVLRVKGNALPVYTETPVYRRFDTLDVEVHGWKGEDDDEMQLALIRVEQGNEMSEQMILEQPAESFKKLPGNNLRTTFQLGSKESPLPIGRYRLELRCSRFRENNRNVLSEFAVVFNPWHSHEQEIRHPQVDRWLKTTLKMPEERNDEVALYRWDLDIYESEVFGRALQAAAGARYPGEAVDLLAKAAKAEVEGYWPELSDFPGNNDDDWSTRETQSVRNRLLSPDKRGQCFDYTAVHVAFLRSIGIPAAAATVKHNADMPHPYTKDEEFTWNFHVWSEVHLYGGWKAIDVTYLDLDSRTRQPWEVSPGLQARSGPWFGKLLGSETRIYGTDVYGNKIELTEAYRSRYAAAYTSQSTRNTLAGLYTQSKAEDPFAEPQYPSVRRWDFVKDIGQ